MATIKKKQQKIICDCKSVGKLEPLCSVGRIIKWHYCHGKQYGDSSKNSKSELPYDLARPPLDMYPKELKADSGINICKSIFMTALFTIAKR